MHPTLEPRTRGRATRVPAPLFELVALDSNLSIADRKISQLRKLRMEPCGNLVKPTDPDYAECAEVK